MDLLTPAIATAGVGLDGRTIITGWGILVMAGGFGDPPLTIFDLSSTALRFVAILTTFVTLEGVAHFLLGHVHSLQEIPTGLCGHIIGLLLVLCSFLLLL